MGSFQSTLFAAPVGVILFHINVNVRPHHLKREGLDGGGEAMTPWCRAVARPRAEALGKRAKRPTAAA